MTAAAQPERSAPSTRKLTGQMAAGFVVRILGIGLSYVAMVFLTRQLGAHLYGMYTAALATASVLAIFLTAGTDRLATRNVSGLTAEHHGRLRREITLTHAIALLGIGLGLILLVCTLIAASYWAPASSVLNILPLVMLAFPVFVLTTVRQWITLPLAGAAKTILPEQLIQPVVLVLTVLAAGALFGRPGVGTIVFAFAAGGFVAWWFGLKNSDLYSQLKTGLQDEISVADLVKRTQQGLPFLSASLATVTMTRTVPLVVGIMCGYAATGQLAPAIQLAALAALPLTLINLVTMPICARLHQTHAFTELRQTARRACTLCVMGTIPIAVGLIVFKDSAAELLGRDFSTTGNLLTILLVGACVNACCGPNGTIMQMTGNEKLYSSTLIMTNTAQIVCVMLAGLTGNLTAIAISIVCVEVIRNIILSTLLWQRTGLVMLPSLKSLWPSGGTTDEFNSPVIYSIDDATKRAVKLNTLDEVDQSAA